MKKSLFIISMLLAFGYKQNNDFKANLTKNSDGSFWVVKHQDNKGEYEYINTQWGFYVDGTSKSYTSFNENIKGHPTTVNIEGSDLSDWTYNAADSILELCVICRFKVEKFNDDTIWMSTVKLKDTLWMSKLKGDDTLLKPSIKPGKLYLLIRKQ